MTARRLTRRRFSAPSMLDVMGGFAAAVLITAGTAVTVGDQHIEAPLRTLGPIGYLLVALGAGCSRCATARPP